jgi:hypothetical protein
VIRARSTGVLPRTLAKVGLEPAAQHGWTWRPAARRAAALTIAVTALGWTIWLVSHEEKYDELAAGIASWPWREASAGLTLLALAAAHLLSAAVAVRSLSDERLPLAPTVWAQLAAGAADRLVPNGVGGVGVNLRYLVRAGITPGAAGSALAILAVVGIATDAGYGALVAVAGRWLGLPGAGHELHLLAHAGLQAGRQHHWFLLASLLTAASVLLLRHSRRPREQVQRGAAQAQRHLSDLFRHPARLTTAAAASAATTVVMSLGFAIATNTWGVTGTPLSNGALVAVYLLAVAVSGAAPIPPFLGGTEAALVTALTVSGYTTPSAVVVVVVFRGLMYWLPLPFGVWGARRLRRVGLL